VQTGAAPRRLRVGLLMLIVDRFPAWWPFLVAPYLRNAPEYTLIAMHTGERPAPPPAGDAHVVYRRVPLDELVALFARKLGTTEARARAKFASGKGLSDLKPFYGKVFEDELGGYSPWGWVDWDLLLGDLRSTLPEEALWRYDAVTLPGATLGFAWAGQLTVMRNTRQLRELFTVVDEHLALGLKAEGDGQSGCAPPPRARAWQWWGMRAAAAKHARRSRGSDHARAAPMRDALMRGRSQVGGARLPARGAAQAARPAHPLPHGRADGPQGAVAHVGLLRPLLGRWQDLAMRAEAARARGPPAAAGAQREPLARAGGGRPNDHVEPRMLMWRRAALVDRPPSDWRPLCASQVDLIQSDPQAFYRAKERVCIRWDLASSPWMCCPHGTGVTYAWERRRLTGELAPGLEAPPATGASLREPAPAPADQLRLP
jgi:hypothetical protein